MSDENSKNKMAENKNQGETYSSVTQKTFVIESVLSDVKPVFIQETDLFGYTRPNKDQFLTHIELYKIIDANVCLGSHIKGLQRVKGLWRIYLDNDSERESMVTSGLVIRDKLVNVYTRNPRIIVHENPNHLKVRVKNVPCSADDGQIERTLEYYGCVVYKSYRERLRVDGMLTNCQTGDRIVMCDQVSKPLPRTMLVGKYIATVLHAGQNTDGQKLVCNKCLQTGHKLMQCPNDWVCRQCKKPGHKQADCTDDLSSNHEDATNEQSDANDADTEDNEAPQSQSILQPLTSMASFSKNLDQGNKSPAKKSGDNVKDLPDPVGDRSRNRRGRNNKNKKNDKPEGNIEQYFNGQSSENTDTPKVKNTGKRNATTPTEDKHKEAGLIQKTKT